MTLDRLLHALKALENTVGGDVEVYIAGAINQPISLNQGQTCKAVTFDAVRVSRQRDGICIEGLAR